MKLIFKPLKYLLFLVITILVIVSIVLILFYKSTQKPNINDELSFDKSIISSLDEFILKTNRDKKIKLEVTEELLNTTLAKAFKESDLKTETEDYVYETDNFKIQGVWTNISNEYIEIVVGIHVDMKLMTYKTTAVLKFDIEFNNNEVVFNLKNIKIGKLKLQWFFSLLPDIYYKATNEKLEDFINKALKNLAIYDEKERKLTIKLEDLVNDNDIIKSVLEFTRDERLVTLEKKEDKIVVMIDFNKLEDTTDNLVLESSDRINSEEEFETYLTNKALLSFFGNENKIEFNAYDITIIIDYLFNNQKGYIYDQLVTLDYKLQVMIPHISIIENKLSIVIPVLFGKDDNYFETKLIIEINITKDNNDLIFEIDKLNIGEYQFANNILELIFLDLDTNEKISYKNNEFTIKDFFTKFKVQNMEINEVIVDSDKLLFKYQLDTTNFLNELKGLNNSTLNEKIDEIISNKDNNINYSAEAENLISLINNLDDAELEKVFDIINKLF